MEQPMYPEATRLLVTGDCGGNNGDRARAWKMNLQNLADATALTLFVCHFPPGTSTWNKLEPRLFRHITKYWRGRPRVSLETVVRLIGADQLAQAAQDRGEARSRQIKSDNPKHFNRYPPEPVVEMNLSPFLETHSEKNQNGACGIPLHG